MGWLRRSPLRTEMYFTYVPENWSGPHRADKDFHRRDAVTFPTYATSEEPEAHGQTASPLIAQRLAGVDWKAASEELALQGNFVIPSLLTNNECRALSSAFLKDEIFSRRILLEQEGRGRGETKYFNPTSFEPVAFLRSLLYHRLSPIATHWNTVLKVDINYPADLPSYSHQSESVGQTTPLSSLSRYVEGDYEGVHQEAYGEAAFPLQAAVLLSHPDRDFNGGEFVMTEQRPRMQSRPLALSLQQGDAVVFATHYRPFKGTSGIYRVNLRHGVSRVRFGERLALSIVFHDGE
jgi:hypothetical protein